MQLRADGERATDDLVWFHGFTETTKTPRRLLMEDRLHLLPDLLWR